MIYTSKIVWDLNQRNFLLQKPFTWVELGYIKMMTLQEFQKLFMERVTDNKNLEKKILKILQQFFLLLQA